jgi:type 1 glutamine amidotransferase
MFKMLSFSILILFSVTVGAMAGPWVNLFNSQSLDGWSIHSGFATYRVEDGAIVGTAVKGSPNTFLCTDKEYGDYILEFEVKCDPSLNSGVQIRSQIAKGETFFVFRDQDGKPRQRSIPTDRVYGYQVEIAQAQTGTCGGIYDEARRAFFIAEVRDDPAAKNAFKDNEWNKYRIECRGSSIKTWVNGELCAELKDSVDAKGIIGLQVHGLGRNFQPYEVRWRNIRIREMDADDADDEIKVVVITGGHSFEHDPFFKMFDQIKGIQYTEAAQKDHSEIFEDLRGWDYDVIVFYNMTQNMSQKRRRNFLRLLDEGVGVVALHHTMGAYQEFPRFKQIIGTKYYLKDTTEGGVLHKGGTYLHDVDFTVHIADKNHPITQGMSDFTIHDETYKNCWFAKDNHVLLTTDCPTSDTTIAWVRNFERARICTIQLGHNSKAYENSNYRQLIERAILWTAGKL